MTKHERKPARQRFWAALRAWLRRGYMRTTSLSTRWGNRGWYVRMLYGIWARFYDWSISLDSAYPRNAERMIDTVVRDGDRVLDVGVGTGISAEYAAARANHYVGIDYSGSMLARAGHKIAARHLANVSLQWGDARSLPFADELFDSVVSSFVLPHFADDEKPAVLGQMVRVLRPGGRLGLFLAQGEIAPLFCSKPRLEQLLSDAGLSDVEIRDVDDVYRIVAARKPGSAPRGTQPAMM